MDLCLKYFHFLTYPALFLGQESSFILINSGTWPADALAKLKIENIAIGSFFY
jgi:hypothetical protein